MEKRIIGPIKRTSSVGVGIRGQGPLVHKVVRGGLVEKVTFKYVHVLKEAGQ